MDRRVEKTKGSIQRAYLELMMEKKNGKITISEVARRANIDRKTFYLHYDSTEDIIREFCRDKVEELLGHLGLEHFPEQAFHVERLFEILNQMIEENIVLLQFVSENREYNYFFDELKAPLVSIIVRGCRKYLNYSDDELKIYAEFYVSGILNSYIRWIREGIPLSIEELAEIVRKSCYGGLESLIPAGLIS